MYNKVLILEVKEKYCLAMKDDGTIVRIVRKPKVKEGDAIYIVDEDIYEAHSNVAYFAEGVGAGAAAKKAMTEKKDSPKRRNNMFKKLTAVAAAAVMLAAAVSMPNLVDKTYATVSVDGEKSVQLSVNKDNEIIKAESFDGSFTAEELAAMEGKNLFDLKDELSKLDDGKNKVLISSACRKENDKDYEDSFVAELKKLASYVNGIYVQGKPSDIKKAAKENKTLGIFLIEKAVDDDVLDDLFEDMSPSELKSFISKYGHQLDDDYIEAIMLLDDDDFDDDDDYDDANDDIDDPDDSDDTDDPDDAYDYPDNDRDDNTNDLDDDTDEPDNDDDASDDDTSDDDSNDEDD